MAVECTAGALVELAKCFSGISPIQQQAIATYLLCQIANNGGSGSGVPAGVILAWSGTIATIPDGWVLCDGTNGTPDLRNRFIAGAVTDFGADPVSTIEGAAMHLGGTNSHSHSVTDAGHQHNFANTLDSGSEILDSNPGGNWNAELTGAVDTATTGITIDTELTVPPWMALAYIMKT